MSRATLARLRHAPRATLNHLSREIVQAETKANLWGRQSMYDRHEWWLTYLERLQHWHFWWVRHQIPHLTRCPDCQRVQECGIGIHHCFACAQEWLVNV